MTQKTAEELPDEFTSHGIALKFAEIFQNHYPRKPIIGMMEDLRKDIESYAASQTEQLREENASLRKQLEERTDICQDCGQIQGPGFQKFSLMQEDPRSIALDSTEVSSSKQEIEQKPDFEVKTDLEKHLAITLRLVQKERDSFKSRIEQEQQQIATEINVRDGVIAMYDFLLEENCELREKLKRYEH